MFKQLLRLTATIFTALVPFSIESTFARPLSTNYQYPETLNPQTNSSICYMETTDGRTLNLNILCAKKVENSDATIHPTLKPANSSPETSSFRSSNNSISTKCYFVDSKGRPCNISN
ncbi:MAG: hypothetical protein KME01_04645 [Chroococcus sp. CMT-3BRIN-NPC107]|jgi:hypothetical protein|nr:hypothetical protein [Chroococcus sp. CMT-3BRIN-NPC107]